MKLIKYLPLLVFGVVFVSCGIQPDSTDSEAVFQSNTLDHSAVSIDPQFPVTIRLESDLTEDKDGIILSVVFENSGDDDLDISGHGRLSNVYVTREPISEIPLPGDENVLWVASTVRVDAPSLIRLPAGGSVKKSTEWRADQVGSTELGAYLDFNLPQVAEGTYWVYGTAEWTKIKEASTELDSTNAHLPVKRALTEGIEVSFTLSDDVEN